MATIKLLDLKGIGSYNNPGFDTHVGGWGDIYMFGLKFDLSDIPSGASVDTAVLKMKRRFGSESTRMTSLGIIVSNGDWNSAIVNWSNKPSNWTNMGGTTYSVPATEGWKDFDITSIVQNWIDGNVNNYGIAIVGKQDYYSNAYVKFENSKSTEFIDGDDPYIEVSFTILLPSISSLSLSHITNRNAQLNLELTSDGGATTTIGTCHSTAPNPVSTDNPYTKIAGVGTYQLDIPNLLANTKYYVRSFATNSAGTSYGAELDFTTDSEAKILLQENGRALLSNSKTIKI